MMKDRPRDWTRFLINRSPILFLCVYSNGNVQSAVKLLSPAVPDAPDAPAGPAGPAVRLPHAI